MQEKKLLIAKKILQGLRDHYGMRTWGELAAFLDVPEGTLGSWRSRGGMNEDIIIAKCKDINIAWVKTGEGELFITKDQPGIVSEPPTGYSPEIEELIRITRNNPMIKLIIPGMAKLPEDKQYEFYKMIRDAEKEHKEKGGKKAAPED